MTTLSHWQRRRSYFSKLLGCIFIPLFLAGCATTSSRQPTADSLSDKQLYEAGRREALAGNYPQAINYIETLNDRSPQSPYATHSLLELAYSYYKSDQYEAAITHIDGYLARQPPGKDIDYAWFLRGLVDLKRTTILLETPQTDLTAASTVARDAHRSFSNIVQQFPKSKYAASANQRIQLLREKMAKIEILQGQALMNQGDYTNAAARAQGVLENFRDTPASSEAIELLREISGRTKGDAANAPSLKP